MSRNANSSVGFAPECNVNVPFSRSTFWRVFGDVIPKNISKSLMNIKFKMSVNELISALETPCNTYLKPNSCTQVRMFGHIDTELYQRCSQSSVMKSIYERYILL